MDSLTLEKIFVLDNFSFVQDKKLFVLSEDAYQKMNKNSAQTTIVMKDMTSELSSTKALKEYLNI